MQIQHRQYPFKIKEQDGRQVIFDIIRKKFVTLTPEEKVRQWMLWFLTADLKIPKSLIAVEMNIKVNQLQKRCDIVTFDTSGKAVLIVECKSPQVDITQDVFDQVARYNLALQVSYLVVTNGIRSLACKMDYENSTYHFVKSPEELKL